MTAQRKIAVEPPAAAQQATGPFVVNLCSSTTPMALTQPQTPELKRFSFFVSRRREEGRERFRLHMGYFATLAEAEEWLNVVRDIFPGAWAGEAPGKKLAERAAAAAAAAAPKIAVAPVAAPAPVVAQPAPTPPVVPTLKAAPVVAPAPKPVPATAARQHAAAKPVAMPSPPKPKAPPAGSNVREVLKSLDDTGATRVTPAPAPSLSDSQVLKILENRQADPAARGNDEPSKGIAMLRPDDTATVRALKEAVSHNAPVSFSVQLQWSVQPIDLAKMPPLAIFSAYTLYTVEGSRDGRKWYGLRLGFFSDAISAKQVASYVRSEFTSVAVIPVSAQERSRATDGNGKAPAASGARPRKAPERRVDEFKLIDDVTDDVLSPGLAAAQAQMKPKKPAPAPSPAKRERAGVGASSLPTAKKTAGRVRATEKRSPQTLEETLEILGASALEIDNGRGELLNDSGVRHLRMERVQKNSPFAKLLERLSERVKSS